MNYKQITEQLRAGTALISSAFSLALADETMRLMKLRKFIESSTGEITDDDWQRICDTAFDRAIRIPYRDAFWDEMEKFRLASFKGRVNLLSFITDSNEAYWRVEQSLKP